MTLSPGTCIGAYEVTGSLGAGGMGVRLRRGYGGFPFALGYHR